MASAHAIAESNYKKTNKMDSNRLIAYKRRRIQTRTYKTTMKIPYNVPG